eukprot:COSAG01_NODE_857_length_13073_cov_13.630415_9_plen_131_part_00
MKRWLQRYHAAAGDWLLEQIGTDLVMDDTRLFYRHLHVWHNNKHEVKRLLLNRIQSYDILDYRYRLLSKNMVEAQKLLLYVSNHATIAQACVVKYRCNSGKEPCAHEWEPDERFHNERATSTCRLCGEVL